MLFILRDNLWLSIAKMFASFHFSRWSLVHECLATADFSSSALSHISLMFFKTLSEILPSHANVNQTILTRNAINTSMFLKFINCAKRSEQFVFTRMASGPVKMISQPDLFGNISISYCPVLHWDQGRSKGAGEPRFPHIFDRKDEKFRDNENHIKTTWKSSYRYGFRAIPNSD